MTDSKQEIALHAIEKVLAPLRCVQTLEGNDKDGVEHLLEMAVYSTQAGAGYNEVTSIPLPEGCEAQPGATSFRD